MAQLDLRDQPLGQLLCVYRFNVSPLILEFRENECIPGATPCFSAQFTISPENIQAFIFSIFKNVCFIVASITD